MLLHGFCGGIGDLPNFCKFKANVFRGKFLTAYQFRDLEHVDDKHVNRRNVLGLLRFFADELSHFPSLFPVLQSHFHCELPQGSLFLAAPGQPVIPNGEHAAKNGGSSSANDGGINGDGRSVSWHSVNNGLVGWAIGYGAGTAFLMLFAYVLEKRSAKVSVRFP